MNRKKQDLSDLIKSKKRVADHGEVFTPDWIVKEMLDLVKDESSRIESRVLEPACGSGNFLVPILERKLESATAMYRSSDFERLQYSFLGLMSIYGVEILEDNAEECRANLLELFTSHIQSNDESIETKAAKTILAANIVEGDALTMKDRSGQPIVFPEWSYLGKGKFNRRDFQYDELLQMSSFGEDTLFASMKPDEIFAPVKDYSPLNIKDIAENG